jgi:hypothetical protein
VARAFPALTLSLDDEKGFFAAMQESGIGSTRPFAAMQKYDRFLGYSGKDLLVPRINYNNRRGNGLRLNAGLILGLETWTNRRQR